MSTILLSATLLPYALAPVAFAQRGMGAQSGVARQALSPDVVSLSGSVLEVKTEPCELTTGCARAGTHILLQAAEGKHLNIHLGPADAVKSIADQLDVGQKVTVQGFRTEIMPEGHYVAQVLNVGDDPVRLRDENLRPFWAGNRSPGPRLAGRQWRTDGARGPGRGRGAGYGRGRGQGRGAGYGRGLGLGYGGGWNFVDANGDGICDRYTGPRR